MAKITFNVSSPDDGLGTELRNAFIGVNSNFTELYDGKVDKETGKGLSTNDYDDAQKNKLAEIAAKAEVNVQPDWSQSDNTQDDYIKNKPVLDNYVNTIGFFDYSNSNTTPLTLVANTEKKLTNDCVGAYTNIDHPTHGVTRIFNSTTNNIVLDELGIGDLVKVRVDVSVTTGTANQFFRCILRLGIGTAKEFEIIIHEEQIKDTGAHQRTFYTGFYVGSEEVQLSLGEIVLLSDHSGSVVVNGFFFEAVKRNVNFVELSGGGGAIANLQQVTDAGTVTTNEVEVAGLKLTDTLFSVPLKLVNENGYLTGKADDAGYNFSITYEGIYFSRGLSIRKMSGTNTQLLVPETTIGSPETIATQEYIASELAGKQDNLTDVNFGAFSNGLTAKTTILDADLVNITDSADSNKSKKVTWLNIWTNYLSGKVSTALASFKTTNFLDFTSSGQTQLNAKKDTAIILCGHPNQSVSNNNYITFGINTGFPPSPSFTPGAGTDPSRRFISPLTGIVKFCRLTSKAYAPSTSENYSITLKNVTQGTSIVLGTFRTDNITMVVQFSSLAFAVNYLDALEFEYVVPVRATTGNGHNVAIQVHFEKS